MNDRTTAYIPKNLEGGTIWDGRLQKRNALEAAVIAGAIYFLTSLLDPFVSSLILVVIRIVLWVLLAGLALKGVGGEPLSIWMLSAINYSNTRTYATLRPPQEKYKKKDRAEKKKERKEKKEKIKKHKLTKSEKVMAAAEKKAARLKAKEEIKNARVQAKKDRAEAKKMEKEARKEAKKEKKNGKNKTR